jgi:hypothetical protein
MVTRFCLSCTLDYPPVLPVSPDRELTLAERFQLKFGICAPCAQVRVQGLTARAHNRGAGPVRGRQPWWKRVFS